MLVTGFEPFGNYSVNPSGEIAKALNGTMVDGVVIVGIVVPVNFTTAVAAVDAAIARYQPVVVVSTGLNARASEIRVEHWAVNLRRVPRSDMNWTPMRRLDPMGPWIRPVSIPVRACVEAVRGSGVPVESSWWAGMYVCNAVLYGELGYVQEAGVNARVGFVHVPLLDSQSPEGLPLGMMVGAVEQVIGSSLAGS